MKLKLKAPGTKVLELKSDEPPSKFAFKINLRRYTAGGRRRRAVLPPHIRGGAVQVHPIKPTLKPPGTNHLKLNYDKLLSNFAFKFNSRHYIVLSIVNVPFEDTLYYAYKRVPDWHGPATLCHC